MKYKNLKKQFEQDLHSFYHQQESSGLFYIALQKVEGSSRMQFLEKQHDELSTETERKLLSILEELKQQKPIQYIVGETLFYNLKFKVNEAVLIPRDETEELVHLIIKTINDHSTKAANDNSRMNIANNHFFRPENLLDVGTGSGCIAIALKKNLPWINATAIDISASALDVAKFNAEINEVEINFIEADALTWTTDQKFDVIVSNPPYIMEAEQQAMHQNVLAFEPHKALFVSNADPLVFYRSIADLARKSLNPGGLLYFEINEQLGTGMQQLMANKGFRDIKLIKDLQQKDRILSCRL